MSHNKTLAAQLYSEFKGFFPNNAILCVLLRLLSAEAYLHHRTPMKRPLIIDKDRQVAPCRHLRPAFGQERCDGGILHSLHTKGQGIRQRRVQRRQISVAVSSCDGSLTCRGDIDIPRESDSGHLSGLRHCLLRPSPERSERHCQTSGNAILPGSAQPAAVIPPFFMTAENHVRPTNHEPSQTYCRTAKFDAYKIYPANLFMTTKEATLRAIHEIEDDLHKQVQWFENEGRPFEAKRLQERVTYDMEMIRELGHCSGIENYSRYFDGRAAGTRPYCLLDFFPEDFLIVIDESHVSVPQIRAMYGGDRARKINLVEYGFRLPAAMDNRPLKFDEF